MDVREKEKAMTTFKVGDRVVCVNNDGIPRALTLGKTYEISRTTAADDFMLINDLGYEAPYLLKRFKLATELDATSTLPSTTLDICKYGAVPFKQIPVPKGIDPLEERANLTIVNQNGTHVHKHFDKGQSEILRMQREIKQRAQRLVTNIPLCSVSGTPVSIYVHTAYLRSSTQVVCKAVWRCDECDEKVKNANSDEPAGGPWWVK